MHIYLRHQRSMYFNIQMLKFPSKHLGIKATDFTPILPKLAFANKYSTNRHQIIMLRVILNIYFPIHTELINIQLN